MNIFKFLSVIVSVTMLIGCAQVAQTVHKVDPRLSELSNNIIGVKNYRYEHVDGEPDQRLIIVYGSSSPKRYARGKEAKNNACPKGTTVDELGRKDNLEKNELKIVVWCKK